MYAQTDCENKENHIKSIEKQDNRWDLNGNYKVPESNDNLYDTLM